MAEWLVLRLTRGPEELVSWMSADAHGQPLGAPHTGALSQAADAAGGRRVAVIVPSSDVLTTQVELPVKSGVRVQQVVPYALEEQLAADIETLHFAVGSRDEASGRTNVAVVTRDLMQQWLATLAAAGLQPDVLCTEAALLPDNPGHVVLMLETDTMWVHRTGQPPLTLPAADLAAVLSAALGAEMISDNLIVYVAPEDWQRRSAEVEALRSHCSSLKVQLLNFGPLPLLAAQLPGGSYLNLLSGDFAPKRALGASWQRWRLVAVLAAALFALHVSGLALQLHEQHRTEQALDEAIDALAGRALPGHPGSAEVRGLVQQRLLAAQGGGDSALMPALALVAQALEGTSNTSIEALNFDHQGLNLKVRSSDAEQIERVNQLLRSNGWQAQLTSGQATSAGYEGSIQARAPGAARSR